MAAFQETDLVLVFDHLTHTLSAVASLHTETPDIEGRYAIAERAIFEALERTARPTELELASLTRRSRRDGYGDGGATTVRLAPARPTVPSPDAGAAAPRRHARRDGPGLRQVEVSLERGEYEAAVRSAKEAIAAGEAIQIVVARRQTFERPVIGGEPLDAVALYRSLRRINPSPYLFFVRMPEFSVVGASPELLVRVEGDHMTTHPIAGTRPRGATPAEDAQLAYALERDPKERAEHVMLVDLGRNDLGRVARPGTVAVTKYMEVERYSHVLHLVSHVEARLKPGCDALDALRSIFPAGTLSGAPKVRAMQLIAEAEKERRGLYGGAVGYLGYDGNLDTAITIRSAVLQGRPGSTSRSGRGSSPGPSRSASSRRPSTRPGRSAGPSRWPSPRPKPRPRAGRGVGTTTCRGQAPRPEIAGSAAAGPAGAGSVAARQEASR